MERVVYERENAAEAAPLNGSHQLMGERLRAVTQIREHAQRMRRRKVLAGALAVTSALSLYLPANLFAQPENVTEEAVTPGCMPNCQTIPSITHATVLRESSTAPTSNTPATTLPARIKSPVTSIALRAEATVAVAAPRAAVHTTSSPASNMVRASSSSLLQNIRYDIAWPQCHYYLQNPIPKYVPDSSVSIVQITRGQPDKPVSECFAQESKQSHVFYVMGGASETNPYATAYAYMQQALQQIPKTNPFAEVWYDFEPGTNDRNQPLWTTSAADNAAAASGALQAVRDSEQDTRGQITLGGMYSTQHFMSELTGSSVWKDPVHPELSGVNMWLPIGSTPMSSIQSNCKAFAAKSAYTTGQFDLLQYQTSMEDGQAIDTDQLWSTVCPGVTLP